VQTARLPNCFRRRDLCSHLSCCSQKKRKTEAEKKPDDDPPPALTPEIRARYKELAVVIKGYLQELGDDVDGEAAAGGSTGQAAPPPPTAAGDEQ
jgi:hypothetical protein